MDTKEKYDECMKELRGIVCFLLANGSTDDSEDVKCMDAAIMALCQMRNRKFPNRAPERLNTCTATRI